MIILCEPQCHGFEHAAFNAALLATVGAAFPGDEILFFSERSHWNEIEKLFSATRTPPLRVNWRRAAIPPPRPGGLRRWPAERKLLQTVLAAARSTPSAPAARAILFCSATEITVLALKQLLRSTPSPCSVRVVLHGVLRSLIEPRWRKPWRWGFSLRQALRTPHPPGLQYIALAESIRARAVRAEPRLQTQLRAMDMPRLWISGDANDERTAAARFGYFGSTAKGFAHFYEMARAVKTQNPQAQFSLVGFLNGRDLQRGYSEEIVRGLARAPLSQAEYSRRAAQVDYAVWPADPAHYSLTASASFLDALDYGKPLIYRANPYIDAYVEKLGDIGYRCETLAEMQTTMAEVAREFPAERYRVQRAAMERGRVLFAPETLAPALREIVEGPCAF